MDNRQYTKLRAKNSAVVAILIALASVGCAATPPQSTEPSGHGEPLPGSFYLTSSPRLAPYDLTIRLNSEAGPSGRSEEFAEGDPIVVNWSTLPLPLEKRININGTDCAGTFEIKARFETDLGLTLTGDTCRIRVLGMHEEGAVDHQPDE